MTTDTAINKIIIIGYGEVGCAFGHHLEQSGIKPLYITPNPKGTDGSRQIQRNLPETIEAGTLILGTFPSAAALTVANDVVARDAEFTYVDLSSSPQALMHSCAEPFENTKANFVDGAIMGSVDHAGSQSPMILSGPNADDAANTLVTLGFNATALPNSAAGDACGLKLLRTLMTKGMESLAIECFAAATAMGLQQELRDNLEDVSAGSFPGLLEAMVRSHVIHAPRRQHEVEAAIGQAQSLGLETPVTQAVLASYQKTTQRIAAEKPETPMDIQQAIEWLAKGLKCGVKD